MTKTFETVRNIKSGKTGWVICRYNRTNDDLLADARIAFPLVFARLPRELTWWSGPE